MLFKLTEMCKKKKYDYSVNFDGAFENQFHLRITTIESPDEYIYEGLENDLSTLTREAIEAIENERRTI